MENMGNAKFLFRVCQKVPNPGGLEDAVVRCGELLIVGAGLAYIHARVVFSALVTSNPSGAYGWGCRVVYKRPGDRQLLRLCRKSDDWRGEMRTE